MSQTAILQDMRSILDNAQQIPGDCSRQRAALSSIGYRAQIARTTPLEFLRDYFFQQFQAAATTTGPTPVLENPTPIDASMSMPGPIICRSCGRTFKTQTALNGHGEARCQARQTSPVSS